VNKNVYRTDKYHRRTKNKNGTVKGVSLTLLTKKSALKILKKLLPKKTFGTTMKQQKLY